MSDAVTVDEAAPALDPRSLAEAARAAILARFPSRSSVCSPMFAPSRDQTWGNPMQTATAERDAELSPTVVGERWAIALRRRYPSDTVKTIMARFNVAEGTAKGWLSGQPPQHRHLVTAVERLPEFGFAVLAEMYAPGHVYQRREELRRDLDALEHRIRAVREAHGW